MSQSHFSRSVNDCRNKSKINQTNKITPASNRVPLHQPLESFVNKIICGDARKVLRKFPDESIDCIVTSPPYWALRDYGMKGQLGLEIDFNEYLEKLLAVFDEVKRVLKPKGACWVNLGDTYGGSSTANAHIATATQKTQANANQSRIADKSSQYLKSIHSRGKYAKCLLQIPSRFALLMTERGWILRNEIIWHKPNCSPASVIDRFTVDFEKIFFFVKQRKYNFRQQFEPLRNPERLKRPLLNPSRQHKQTESYWFSADPEISEKRRMKMLEKGRNKRCVWTAGTVSFKGNHFAVYPPKLIETPIKAGCPEGGIVLDPFIGSGTTALVAKQLKRNFIGIDLNPEYVKMAKNRLKQYSS